MATENWRAKQIKERNASTTARRVLVVEDEAVIGLLIVDVLREDGIHVEFLGDGMQALKRLLEERFDLVVCDIKLPSMSGFHIYEALMNDESLLRPSFLFVTACGECDGVAQFMKSNGIPYISKPFLTDELRIAVRNILDEGLPKPKVRRARAGS